MTMRKESFWLVGALWFLMPGSVSAQPPAKDHLITAAKEREAITRALDQQVRLTMAEDVEIMRRLLNQELLNRRLAACVSCRGSGRGGPFTPDTRSLTGSDGTVRIWDLAAQSPKAVAFSPDGRLLATSTTAGTVRLWDPVTGKQLGAHAEPPHTFAPAEGVYLDGHGVVYTVTLPGPVIDSGAATAKPAPKELNEWEQQRQQLRGKVETPAPDSTPKEPPLREGLLKLLARHGHNFAQLAPRETLTVVITFREPKATPIELGLQGLGTSAGSPPTKGKTGTGGQPALVTASRDYELMGDLHLKHNRAHEAVEAYKNAITKLGGSAEDGRKAELFLKFGRAQLAAAEQAQGSNRDERILEAIKFLRRITEKTTKPAPPAPPARLPAKLVVSASKSLLDQMAAGKITFEEFRSRANIEFVPSATLQKGTAPKMP